LKKASEAAKQLARARGMVADTEAAIQALNAQACRRCDAVSDLNTVCCQRCCLSQAQGTSRQRIEWRRI